MVWIASDDTLLAGLAAGDSDAASAFVQRFQRRVFGLAMTIVADRGVAEDVAQETFARAWRHAAAFDARRGTVATWLLTITRNLAIDAVRLRRAVVIDPETLGNWQQPSRDRSPDDAVIANDDAARVRNALGELPIDQRRALVQAAFLGRTAREISEIEGIPLGTAKTRIRSAMLRLRAVLVSQEYER